MSDRFLSFFNSRQNQISRGLPNLQIGLAASFRAPPLPFLKPWIPMQWYECRGAFQETTNVLDSKMCQRCKISKSVPIMIDLGFNAWLQNGTVKFNFGAICSQKLWQKCEVSKRMLINYHTSNSWLENGTWEMRKTEQNCHRKSVLDSWPMS